jgi:hypothetical protein
MRRLIPGLLAIALALATAGCKRPQPRVDTIEDQNQPPLSSVHAADSRASGQLLSGFYAVESNAWRWTMGKFSVALVPPPGAAQKGAQLEVRFAVPEPVISRRKAVTLSVSVEGQALAPEAYTASGEHTYLRDVPAAALAASPVKIDFALDRYLAAGEVETRELGVVFTSAALRAK